MTAICPCCHGEGWVQSNYDDGPVAVACHCQAAIDQPTVVARRCAECGVTIIRWMWCASCAQSIAHVQLDRLPHAD